MKLRFLVFSAFVALFACLPARADEGMWMVNTLSRALVQNMQREGLRLPAGTIYDESRVSLSDAIVSLDFGCTGSMVSEDGLLITNHHCAYADLHALSDSLHDYLQEGFWAYSREEELPVKGKTAYFLRKVLDVTDEVAALRDSLERAGIGTGMRKLSHLMETRYQEKTGLEAGLSEMWAGEKYYLALYETCRDLRIVAAPPASIAAFGGDIDNWEWPQQKCDFAIYRCYKDGKPYHPRKHLKISTKGVKEGDFTMVLGYPGRTDRYASAAKVRFMTEVSLPICNEVRGAQMQIIKKQMERSAEVRRKYEDKFFSLSNVQELQEGQTACSKRFNVAGARRAEEARLALPDSLLKALDAGYEAIAAAERNRVYYRETLVRGTRLSLIATRLNSLRRKPDARREAQVLAQLDKDYAAMDPATEKALLRYSLQVYYENVDSSCWGPYQKQLYRKYGTDFDALCEALWPADRLSADAPLCRFFGDVGIADFNRRVDSLQGTPSLRTLGRRYTRAVYAARDKGMQYPDANSTMRLSYGSVKGYAPVDGLYGHWQSTHRGILEKVRPGDFDYGVPAPWERLLRTALDIPPVDFLTDNDITGGNSGSPVLNARGEIIGLAFDGNKESLASDWSYTPDYNRCVCVDIRFVLWTLRHYARMDTLLAELGF